MELQIKLHHVFRLMYHFVWISKYRNKVFRDPYHRVLKKLLNISEMTIIEIAELEIP